VCRAERALGQADAERSALRAQLAAALGAAPGAQTQQLPAGDVGKAGVLKAAVPRTAPGVQPLAGKENVCRH
jgi:hypothetical protein